MKDNVTRELIAMVVRIGAVAAILSAFYMTVGIGDNTQLFGIAGAAAFGSQATALLVRRVLGDARVKSLLIVGFAAIAIGCTLFVVLR